MTAWGGVIVAVVAGLASVLGAWLTSRASSKASPYEALAKRVVDLETQVDQLLDQRKSDRREISDLHSDRDLLVEGMTDVVEWVDSGAHPPPPHIRDDLRRILQALPDPS